MEVIEKSGKLDLGQGRIKKSGKTGMNPVIVIRLILDFLSNSTINYFTPTELK